MYKKPQIHNVSYKPTHAWPQNFLFVFLFTVSLFTFDVSPIYTQPIQEWARRYSDTSASSWGTKAVKLDNTGNIYVLAETNNDFGFLKYSPTGNLLCLATNSPVGFSNGFGDYFDLSPSGDVYVTGHVSINFNSWIYTAKFNTNGVFQWGRVYNPDNGDVVNDIKVDRNGNVIIGGGAANGNSIYGLIIKYNSQGDTLWTSHFNNGQNHASIEKITIDDTNNIYTTGYISGKCYSLKYGPTGNIIWSNSFTFDSTQSNIGRGISIDNLGNIYVIGTQSRLTDDASYLLKLNNNGLVLWAKQFGNYGSGNESLWGPVISSDRSSIYYTATKTNSSNGYDQVTLKYNSLGDTQWVRLYHSGSMTALNLPAGITLDKFNNIYVTGVGNFPGTGDDFVTIKYLSSGTQQWVATYSGEIVNGGDNAVGLAVDTNLNVYVVGPALIYLADWMQ